LAWYHSTPIDPNHKQTYPSRWKTNKEKVFPKTDDIDYLISMVIDTGIHEQYRPISYQEIIAWSKATGFKLKPVYTEIIRHCSMEYCSFYHKSSDPMQGMPYQSSTPMPSGTIEDKFNQIQKRMRSNK
jgi:hypothetical protein